MANTTWRAINARCPFYRRSNALCITCSPSDESTREMRHKLASEEDCSDWFRAYCSRRYTQCIYYSIIDTQVANEEETP